jgi:IS30 family transposase
MKSPMIKAYVSRQLKRSWSPEMIAGQEPAAYQA